ncbi:hypothetical protein, partial [Escherichia coli]
MYTQTLYELSQEAERLLQLSHKHMQLLEKMPHSVPPAFYTHLNSP